MDLTLERITAKKAEIIFWLIFALLLAITTIFPYATDKFLIKVTLKIVIGCSIGLWVYADTKKFKDITQDKAYFYSLFCIILPEIGALIYTFSSRGFKRGVIGLGKFILKLFVVGLVAVFVLSIFGYE